MFVGRCGPSREGYSICGNVVTLPGGLQPSWEFNYTPGRIIVFPGRPGRGSGASTLVKHSTYSDTLKMNVFE